MTEGPEFGIISYMTFRKETLAGVVISAIVIVGSFMSGLFVGGQHEPLFSVPGVSAATSSLPSRDLSTFWKVWDLLNEKYVFNNGNSSTTKVAVTDDEKLWGATEGLVKSFGDPYTVYFPPDQAKLFDSNIEGNFEGVGMEIGIQNNTLTVVAPLKDSPAEKAGIKAGDKVIKIDGQSAADISVEAAVKLIRGKKGTPVVVSVLRDGLTSPKDISITRDTIVIPTIKTQEKSSKVVNGKVEDSKDPNLTSGVYVVHLFSFGAASADDFSKAINSFAKSGSKKLIIDLRGNPGGYLDAAVDMASWFLPKGATVVTEKGRGDDIVYKSYGYDLPEGIKDAKVAVLIDKGSASASEIFSGAMQDYGRAKLIGDKSFGKGSVQELLHLDDGSSVKITVARWYTPKNRSISLAGLEPDIKVSLSESDLKNGKDAQTARAIEYLNTGK